MLILLSLVSLFVVVGILIIKQSSTVIASVIVAVCLAALVFIVPLWLSVFACLGFVLYLLLTFCRPVRIALISRPLMNYMKKTLPIMSNTERVALDAGDVWFEGSLFQGQPDWQLLDAIEKPCLTTEEQAFLDNETATLCKMINDWQCTRDGDLPKEVWDYIKQQGFLGLIIPKRYGGKAFSALAHSSIVSKIASRSISAAVTVMVPNSLGPAELLLHYGTDDQKNTYLPELAAGREIPCFALTAPNAGSDAGAIADTGTVVSKQTADGEQLFIQLSWDKRYITLAPVATLLGVAFKLSDPDNLLAKEKVELGISLALIPTTHDGVEVGQRHSPLGLSFMNGTTRGKDVLIPIDYLIGGQALAGQGWRMLMECLSVGRSISLPALATASAKLSYRMTGAYARLRQQFKVSIGQFEGVEEALARIGGKTYLMESVRLMTANAVDLGVKPSLVSAITKYHLTELARQVVDDSMDIHAGRGVQFGPRNYLANHYLGLPMSITVEGANILTRNLIIFGQGAVRCHPFVQQEMALVAEDFKSSVMFKFDEVITQHISYGVRNGLRAFVHGISAGKCIFVPQKTVFKSFYQQLTRMSINLSVVADLAMALLGGELKRKERLSARLGDVLSYIYMGSCVLKYFKDNGEQQEDMAYVQWAMSYCLSEIQIAFDDFFQNFPQRWCARLLKRLLFPWGRAYLPPSDKVGQLVSQRMQSPSPFRDRLTEGCYVGDNEECPTGRVELAFKKVVTSHVAYQRLQQSIRGGQIPRMGTIDVQINAAVTAGIINQQEAELLLSSEKSRVDALDVDEFAFEALLTTKD